MYNNCHPLGELTQRILSSWNMSSWKRRNGDKLLSILICLPVQGTQTGANLCPIAGRSFLTKIFW